MIGGESFSDGEQADTGEEFGEDLPDDRGGLLVRVGWLVSARAASVSA
ncbi:hypothetical protein [Salinispora oceanensis]|nr:hypothetical protein [Salinispora oceanensis]